MRKTFCAALIALLPLGAAAQDMSALERPGTVALMRHALAPGGGDPANFKLNVCNTQRTLSDQGRAQARKIGQAMRDAGIRFDYIFTSQWCRTRETAKLLGMGPVTDLPGLNSFFSNRSTAPSQRNDVLATLSDLPKDARILLVTHQVNISDLTGQATRSGEIIIAARNADGTLTPSASILITP